MFFSNVGIPISPIRAGSVFALFPLRQAKNSAVFPVVATDLGKWTPASFYNKFFACLKISSYVTRWIRLSFAAVSTQPLVKPVFENKYRLTFALSKQCRILILLSHNVNFRLLPLCRIRSPPAAQTAESYRTVSWHHVVPKILHTDIFKNTSHIIRQIRGYPSVSNVGDSSRDHGAVYRYKPVPEAEHIVLNGIYRLFGRLFPIRSFFPEYAEFYQTLDIIGADISICRVDARLGWLLAAYGYSSITSIRRSFSARRNTANSNFMEWYIRSRVFSSSFRPII